MTIIEEASYYPIRENIDRFLTLELDVFNKFGRLYDNAPWRRLEFRTPRNEKDNLSCVVRLDSHLVGFSISYEFAARYAHIARFAISPTCGSMGLGSQLMNFQLKLMERNNYEYCSVDLMKSNSRAIFLYEKFGFQTLQGHELKNYLHIKKRDQGEYLGTNSTHVAMLKRL
jgi:ribosomal protein S18 acetylase RimI-like enzyme